MLLDITWWQSGLHAADVDYPAGIAIRSSATDGKHADYLFATRFDEDSQGFDGLSSGHRGIDLRLFAIQFPMDAVG